MIEAVEVRTDTVIEERTSIRQSELTLDDARQTVVGRPGIQEVPMNPHTLTVGRKETGGRLVKYARYHWLLLVESHLTPQLFGAMLGRIAALPTPPG